MALSSLGRFYPLRFINRGSLLAGGVFLLLVGGYFLLGLQFYHLGGYDSLNRLFDFDSAWYLDALGRSADQWQVLEPQRRAELWIKHPLLYGFRAFTVPLTWLGMSASQAAILLVASASALTVSVLFSICRILSLGISLSIGIAGLYGLSAVSLITGGMPEAYPLVNVPVALMWLLMVRAICSGSLPPLWLRALLGATAAGITLIFLVFYGIVELALLMHRQQRVPRPRDFLEQQFWHGPLLLLGFLLLGVVLVYLPYLGQIFDALLTVGKQLLWAVAQKGEKAGALQVFFSLFVFPLQPPGLTLVDLGDEGMMADFRGADPGGYTMASAIAFYALVVGGCAVGIADRRLRPLLLAVLAWLVFVYLFHLQYQYRGSVFMYSPHHWFTLFIPLAVLGRFVSRLTPVWPSVAYNAALYLLLVATIYSSVGSLWDLWDFLDTAV